MQLVGRVLTFTNSVCPIASSQQTRARESSFGTFAEDLSLGATYFDIWPELPARPVPSRGGRILVSTRLREDP